MHFKGLHKGVGNASDKKFWVSGDLFAVHQASLNPHLFHCCNPLDGIEIKDFFGLRVITSCRVVSCEAEDILDPQGQGTQKVTLKGNTVPIPCCHLQDGFYPHVQENL